MNKSEIDSTRHHRIYQYARIVKIDGLEIVNERITPLYKPDRAAIRKGYQRATCGARVITTEITKTMVSGHHFKGPISERGVRASIAEYERKLDI